MNNYKILLSAYACQPGFESEPGFGWSWATHLAQLGYDVWVLTRSEGREAIESAMAELNLPNLRVEYVDLPNWVTHYLSDRLKVAVGYLAWQIAAYKYAKHLDHAQDFSIIHHVTYGSITTGSWLWLMGKPFVFGPVGGGQVAPEKFKAYFGDGWNEERSRSFFSSKLAPYNLFMRATLRNSVLVLATNKETAQMAEKFGAEHVELFLDTGLPETYIPQQFPRHMPSDVFQVLWVGRLFPRKGLLLALDALTKIPPGVTVKLTVVGGGYAHWIDMYKQYAKSLHYETHVSVEFLGQIPWHEVKKAYLTSDVFLFTSLRDSFGSQLLEAMAHGLPIIALNHQGVRDMLPNSASIKVPVNNPDETMTALAESIQSLAHRPSVRLQMALSAYGFAKSHTWTAKAKAVSSYYERILG